MFCLFGTFKFVWISEMWCEVQGGKTKQGLLVGDVGCRMDGKIQQSSFPPVVNVIYSTTFNNLSSTVHL